MLESRTDYYVLLSEAFGPAVPATREARKIIYDGVRRALKEQAKLVPHRFDLTAEQRALEKAILDVEISAKLGQTIPRHMPGSKPPAAGSRQPLQLPVTQPAFEARPVSHVTSHDPLLPSAQQPSGPRIEWANPNAIPLEEQETYPPPSMPGQPAASLPSNPPVSRPAPKNYQPAFLNRPDRVSYARRADPPPPPRPAAKKELPTPPKRPEVTERPSPPPASPPPSLRAEADDMHRIDAGPEKKGRQKAFRPPDRPQKKPRFVLRLIVIVAFAACAAGAIAYFLRPEQLIRQLIAEYQSVGSTSESNAKPSPTGASVSIGDSPAATVQDFVQLAIAQTGKREFSQALATLERAEKMGANGGEFYQARAYAFWGSGNLERAITDYGEAIRLDPGNATNFANRAVAYNARGEYTLAIRDLERSIAIDPGNPDHWNSRCWSRTLAGQMQEAIVDCNESLRLRPNDPNTLDSRGFAHLKAGQNSRAIADFNAVLALAPKTASSLYGRGLARMRAGDRPNGVRDVEEAKTIAPDIENLFGQYGVR
jgi:tetratricopeptide (TPR) repeat protein